jgi:DNA-directed RNA polymerase specialized sigma24 family protein
LIDRRPSRSAERKQGEETVGTEISLADARLLQRLRRGDPDAVRVLWDDAKDDLWSVCAAMTDDRVARDLLKDLYEGLWRETRGWRNDHAICCLLASYAWRRIAAVLELPPLRGIGGDVPSMLECPNEEVLRARIAGLSGPVRLVYLLDLFFACPLDVLAELTSLQASTLREARAEATFALLRRGAP